MAATSSSVGVVKMALAKAGSIRWLIVPDEMTVSAVGSFVGNAIITHDLQLSASN